jgi:hypothetical protein
MFATRNLSENRRGGDPVGRAEDAYGPSPIDSSSRHSEQIDLWMRPAFIRLDRRDVAAR